MKFKKLYYMVVFLLLFTAMFTVKAGAETKYPVISNAFLDHSPLIEGDAEYFYVISDYDGPVQYRVKVENLSLAPVTTTSSYTKTTTSTALLKPTIIDYSIITDGRTPYKVNLKTKFKAGTYRATVYVKRAGETGNLKDKECNYDNIYRFNLTCVAKDETTRVYANGDMILDRTTYTYSLGETVAISGIKNIKGRTSPYQYKLHVFDVKNKKWIMDVTSYSDTVEWIPEAAGDYILDVWVTSSDSKEKYEAYKMLPISVVGDFKVDYIKAMNPNVLIVKFNNKPKLSDVQNKSNYYISTSDIDTVTLLPDNRSVQLKLKKSIANETLYFVDSIRYDVDNMLSTEPFSSTERYSDTTMPYVKKITCDSDTAKITFSESMKTLGSAKIVQGDLAKDVSELLTEGNSEISVPVKEFSPNENISFVALGAKDMFDNSMTSNPYSIYFKKNKTDYTKPTTSGIKSLSTTRVEVSFSERLKTAPIVYIGTKPVVFDSNSSSDNKTFTGTIPQTYGKTTAKVVSYKDMSGNEGNLFEQDVEFKFDNIQPKLIGNEIKSFNNKLYLVVHYDEAVYIYNSFAIYGIYKFKFANQDYSYNFYKIVAPIPYSKAFGADFNDEKSIMIDITDNSDFPEYDYEISIPYGAVRDIGEYHQSSMDGEVKFTKTAYTNNKSKPYVINDPDIAYDYSYMDIPFSEDMDLNTVLTLENYTANDVAIFNRAELLSDKRHVRLYVAKNLIEYSGDRMLEITGLKDKYGNEMEKYRKIVYIRENDKPYIDYAVVESQSYLEVVFNEYVKNISDNDFSVYINGSMIDKSKVSIVMDNINTKQIRLHILDYFVNLKDPNTSVQVKVDGKYIMDMSNNYMDSGAITDVLK